MANVNLAFGKYAVAGLESAPAISLESFEDVTNPTTSQQSTFTAPTEQDSESRRVVQVTVFGTGDIYVQTGANPVAANADGARVMNGTTRDFLLLHGEKIAVINAT